MNDTYVVFTTDKGIVYEGHIEEAARNVYNTYAYGDMRDPRGLHSVILFKNDEPIMDHYGTMTDRYGLEGVIS